MPFDSNHSLSLTVLMLIVIASILHLTVVINGFIPTISILPCSHHLNHQINPMKINTRKRISINSLMLSDHRDDSHYLTQLSYASSNDQNDDYNNDDDDVNMRKQNAQSLLNQNLTNEDDCNSNEKIVKDEEIIDPIYILPIATTMTILAVLSILLYNIFTNPMTSFDIDFYMALDGTLNNSNAMNTGVMDTSGGGAQLESITGLPPLSPAEKIVGAFFGPPSGNHY